MHSHRINHVHLLDGDGMAKVGVIAMNFKAECFAWFVMARIGLEQSSRPSDLDSVSF
ncbi:hypothetical protein RB2150_08388 [Rhodobacterales bacterium HTCC2150]|nr:hypothetical protein RB2150_08388 [Rhodobacterales bacterium HTCC2150] [Rhodobacteraceae bacterium HTCC2150]